MALRMFAGTYAVPEAGAPIARPVLCQSFERLGTAVPFGLGVIEGQVHGWRLALNLSLFPQVCVFARSYECGQASAVPERAHGRGDIGAPASGTASLLNSHQKPSERRPPARRRSERIRTVIKPSSQPSS
jgi:hypothetical protein